MLGVVVVVVVVAPSAVEMMKAGMMFLLERAVR